MMILASKKKAITPFQLNSPLRPGSPTKIITINLPLNMIRKNHSFAKNSSKTAFVPIKRNANSLTAPIS